MNCTNDSFPVHFCFSLSGIFWLSGSLSLCNRGGFMCLADVIGVDWAQGEQTVLMCWFPRALFVILCRDPLCPGPQTLCDFQQDTPQFFWGGLLSTWPSKIIIQCVCISFYTCAMAACILHLICERYCVCKAIKPTNAFKHATFRSYHAMVSIVKTTNLYVSGSGLEIYIISEFGQKWPKWPKMFITFLLPI